MAVSEHTTTLPVSRRRLLAGTGNAVAATAGAMSVLSVAAPAATQADLVIRMAEILSDAKARQNPDAELLAAFVEANAIREWMDGPDAGDDDIPDHTVERYTELVKQIASMPACTAEGVAAKLSTFTAEIQGCVYSHKGDDEAEGLFPTFIRTALEGAQRMAGGMA